MTYFALGGFLVLHEMDKEQRELDEQADSEEIEDVNLGQGDTSEEDSDQLTDASFDA